jgi:hypothetical protein
VKNLSVSTSTVVLLAVSLFLISAGFWYKEFPKSAPQTPLSPTPTPTAQPSPDPTSTLRTYRNEKYGFEFHYPVFVKIGNENNARIPEGNASYLLYFEFCGEYSCGMENDLYLTVEPAPVSDITQLKYDYVGKRGIDPKLIKEKGVMMLGGEKALWMTFITDNTARLVQVIHNRILITFLVSDYAFQEGFTAMVLSSFKFTR